MSLSASPNKSSCFDCSKAFNSGLDLACHKVDSHLLIHAYICSLCNDMNTNEKSMKEHILTHHLHISPEEQQEPFADPQVKIEQLDEDEQVSEQETLNAPFAADATNTVDVSLVDPNCNACQGGFSDITDLGAHLETHKKDNRKRIRVASGQSIGAKRAPSPDSQLGGIKTEPEDWDEKTLGQLYSCDECDKKFYYKLIREQHVQVSHRGLPRDACHALGRHCDALFRHCPQNASFRHIVLKHMRDDLEFVLGRAECGECGLRVAKQDELAVHVAMRHPALVRRSLRAKGEARPAPFACPACGDPFFFEEFRAQHLAMRHAEGAADGRQQKRCVFCPKVLAEEGRIFQHIANFHMKDELRIVIKHTTGNACAFCGLQCNSRPEMAKHMIIRHKEKTYDMIQGIRKGSSRLRPRPVPVKEVSPELLGEIPPGEHLCPEEGCGKRFHYELMLGYHQATVHEGRGQIQCHICNFEFTKNSRSFRHLLEVHLGHVMRAIPGNRICPVCGKTFTNSHGKKLHMLREHAYYVKFMVGGEEQRADMPTAQNEADIQDDAQDEANLQDGAQDITNPQAKAESGVSLQMDAQEAVQDEEDTAEEASKDVSVDE